jgi:homoserine O-acetyltransferase/O-succinyltransferase
VRAVIGASMGGAQALQWAVSHPQRVACAIVIAGNARTTLYGRLFLHTVKSALLSDPAFAGGAYTAPPLVGLSRLSSTWAAFALSPRFFSTGRHLAHTDMAAPDLEGFLAKWSTRYHTRDANDLLCHLAMWDAHDVGAATTRVPLLFLPISTDTYFHADDVRDQAAAFANARVQVIESLSGHAAAFGREAADREAICAAVAAFLA